MRLFRSLAALLCAFAMILIGTACRNGAPEKTTSSAITTTAEAATEPEKSEEDLMELFHNSNRPTVEFGETTLNRLSAEAISALPVANEKMSKAELRKLCVDYFELQLTFLWESNLDVTDYPTTYAKFKNEPKTLMTGNLYSGVPYQSTGNGNLYRWLEYYDEETGVMDLARAFAENGGYGEGAVVNDVKKDANGNVTYQKYRAFRMLFNQCSVGAFWGWARVVNSANFGGTAVMNVHSGFIPVGLYTYPHMETIANFGVADDSNPAGYDTKDVIRDRIREKGDNGMADCYAMMQAGDCLVSQGHAMMVKSVSPKFTEEGKVIRSQSTAVVIEQIENWGKKDTMEGKPFFQQGGVNRVYTFTELQQQGYLPFTFAEFLDESVPLDRMHLEFYREHIEPNDPVTERYTAVGKETEEVKTISGIGVEKGLLFSDLEGKSAVSVQELNRATISANYPISDIFLTVKDAEGKVLQKNIYRSLSASTRVVTLTAPLCSGAKDAAGKELPVTHGLDAFAGGSNTVEATVQLSNGQLLTAFSLPLNP